VGKVEYLGQVGRDKVFELMKSARALIVPSTWNEPFGLIIIEAFAIGLAVIASDHEPINGIVENNKTGLLYFQNDTQDLTRKTEWAWRHPQEMSVIGQSAYAEYLNKYTADKNYLRLMEIYNLARDKKHHDPA
jgi:glycosyltransferase involved in cell wall biosynthesis